MCGIIGYVGTRPAVDILIQGLKRLEYRGYDSAGVAFVSDGKVEIVKSEGRLENLERLLAPGSWSNVTSGIGHTRWATHGKPTTQNAHPHRAGHVVLVHNGIIENYQEIRKEIIRRGHAPQSETDSELFGFLVLDEMDGNGRGLVEAVREAFRKIEGQCSVVILSEREPGTVVGVRNGSPLVAAIDPRGGAALASDAQPLLGVSRDVYFLEHGDIAVATRGGVEFRDLETGAKVDRAATRLDGEVGKLDKQGFPHYMLKEIHEQPTALVDTLNGLLDRASGEPFALAEPAVAKLLLGATGLTFVACGSAWHSALLGKYWLERWARIPCGVELASEFRYRSPVLDTDHVVIAVSQSGETADTLAVVRQAKKLGSRAIALTNVRGSTISREADAVLYMSAGPEIGVAATKTFTAQMISLLILTGYLASRRKAWPREEITSLFDDLIRLPHLLAGCLEPGSETALAIRRAVPQLAGLKGFFFIGRGYSYPIALEGALKLKEIAYLHAEGYAAGELKHGPIAMIDGSMAVVVLAPKDSWRDKTLSNLEEVKARGAVVIGVGDGADEQLGQVCDHWIPISSAARPLDPSLMPFPLSVAMQLLSYELALRRGTDIDKPRNLAKSVTVE